MIKKKKINFIIYLAFSVRLFALLGAENVHKAEEKLRLAQPKTQLFDKSCVLDSGKNSVQNAQNLWTS